MVESDTLSHTLSGLALSDEIHGVARRVAETGTTYEGGKFRTYYRSWPPTCPDYQRVANPTSHTGMIRGGDG